MRLSLLLILIFSITISACATSDDAQQYGEYYDAMVSGQEQMMNMEFEWSQKWMGAYRDNKPLDIASMQTELTATIENMRSLLSKLNDTPVPDSDASREFAVAFFNYSEACIDFIDEEFPLLIQYMIDNQPASEDDINTVHNVYLRLDNATYTTYTTAIEKQQLMAKEHDFIIK